ncbi:MAG: nucleotide exchange factor GrpE [Spirochaetae bacterium HGW-Spirochaetae-5]|nr:MAG: nucleotide exchange factor GrpE [Spirochaetae bacterium HGW-Spirochaetae-5]
MGNQETTAKENKNGAENNVNETENCCEDVKGLENEISNQDEEIIRLNKEVDTLKDLLQRRQADFENFRKRTAKLQEDYRKLAIKDFAFDIINVNDDISRAIEASDNLAEKESADAKDSFIEGIKLVSKRIEEILSKYGIEEIEAENKPFNPNFHEALEIENSENHTEETVTKVYQKGFKLDEHLVRSAKVRVSKPAPKKTESADDN